MVHITAKTGLTPRRPLQSPADVLRALAVHLAPVCGFLQPLSPPCITQTAGVYSRTAVRRAIARGGKVDDAQVHTHEVGYGERGVVRQLDDHQEKPPAIVSQHQMALALGFRKALPLVGAHDKRHQHTPVQRQQADMIDALEAHETLVIWHGRMRAKRGAAALIALVGTDDTGDTAHSHLRR